MMVVGAVRITTSFFSGMLSGTANYTGGFVGQNLKSSCMLVPAIFEEAYMAHLM